MEALKITGLFVLLMLFFYVLTLVMSDIGYLLQCGVYDSARCK